jgi:hypothetical protein
MRSVERKEEHMRDTKFHSRLFSALAALGLFPLATSVAFAQDPGEGQQGEEHQGEQQQLDRQDEERQPMGDEAHGQDEMGDHGEQRDPEGARGGELEEERDAPENDEMQYGEE